MSAFVLTKLRDMPLIASVEFGDRGQFGRWLEVRADKANRKIVLTMRPRAGQALPSLSAETARALAAALVVGVEHLTKSTTETGEHQ